jgi:monofunctional biosynthetic peptidoglycan transglycosylase
MRRLVIRAGLAGAALAIGYVVYVVAGLPRRDEVRALARTNPGTTGVMRQRAREAARRGRTARVDQRWVPLDRVSKRLIEAVIASEDQKFFGHEGVDWGAIKESAEKDLQEGRAVRGGSTITQQLAKNLFFDTGRTVTRKLRELVVARWLEEDLSKSRILALYLNVIEWGDGVYGVEAAARRYYGKAAAELDVAEAAGLAAMIPNPRRLNPAVNAARHARARRRVLWLMATAGFIRRETAGLGSEPPPVEDDEAEDDRVEAGDLPPLPADVPPTVPAVRSASPEPASADREAAGADGPPPDLATPPVEPPAPEPQATAPPEH